MVLVCLVSLWLVLFCFVCLGFLWVFVFFVVFLNSSVYSEMIQP